MESLETLAQVATRVAAASSMLQSASTSPTDHGTPFYHGPDDIPIDPALHGPPVDPALLAPDVTTNGGIEIPAAIESYNNIPTPFHLQYFQGPQGDPFAPQPPPTYLPVEIDRPATPKPAKKKRKPRRETECSFCGGDDTKNKESDPEVMVSCADCGRSGHPTCLKLADQAETLRSYEWQCTECKTCEVCKEKDGDNHFLLCDSCDRGWHMECLDPPLEQEPPGAWYCPRCPPPAPEPVVEREMFSPEIEFMASCPPAPPVREVSVASSSRSAGPNGTVKSKAKGKGRAVTTDESEADADVGKTPTRSSRRKSTARSKAPVDGSSRAPIDVDVIEMSPLDGPRSNKRPRVRLSMPPPKPPTIRLRLPARGKGKERAEDPDEPRRGMFDDLLPSQDREVSATLISQLDKQRFDKSRSLADEKLMPPPPLPDSAVEEQPVAESSTRPLRSTHHPAQKFTPGPSTSPAPSTPLTPHHESYLRIRYIRFGEFDIRTWYDAPFPEEYMTIPDGRLWICEFCLKYMKSQFNACRHRLKCKMRHPPGDEIYRDGAVAIFEVDGRKNKIYCQNLCLLSKMFLDHKSLFYDVEPFLFYVITEVDEVGARFVGYFSKEKRSPKDYNVSCIMTLPVRQRQGWGNLLIDFSYLLSKKERRTGSPEKPLSALGALGYRNYWTLAVMRYLRTAPDNPRLEDVSAATAMTLEDVCTILTHLNMIDIHDRVATPRPLPGQSIKTVKGRKSGVARKHLQRTATQDDEKVKGPFVPPTSYDISWDRHAVEEHLVKWEAKGYLKLRPENLKWSPFLIARARKSDGLPLEDGMPQSATEVTTPSTDALVTPLAGPSSDGGLGTASPAFALFDDDNVEITRRSAAGEDQVLPSLSEDGQSRSPQRPRRHRSDSQASVEPEVTPRPKRPRRSTTQTVIPRSASRRQSERPTPRRTRSVIQSPGQRDDTDLIAEDAALAARLAMEEGRPRRQLRSRSNTEQELPRPVSPSTPRSVSPRKRKRVESPVTVTTPSTGRQTRSSALLSNTPRPTPTRRSSTSKASSKKRKPPPRRPSRLAKEVHAEPDGAAAAEQEAEEEEAQSVVSSLLDPDRVPEPPLSPTPSLSVHHAETDSGQAAPEGAPDPPAPAHAEPAPDTEMAPAGPAEDEAGYEDTGTPLTGATSRQSVGHSDDTIIAMEETTQAALKIVPPAVEDVVGREEPLPDVRPAPNGDVVLPDVEMAPPAGEGDADVDAEGEGEEDAEGELDAEGEDDIDAEGEVDMGEDLGEFDEY